METFTSWPLAHALGAPDSMLALYRKIWEAHRVQFARAKSPSTQMAKDGMYFKEFPAAFDWEHNAEGFAAFLSSSLAAPKDPRLVERMRRFADFYVGGDAATPNYVPRLRSSAACTTEAAAHC
jgi:hypothetical protein